MRRPSTPLLRLFFVGCLAGILVAGLAPFRAPSNQVKWLKDRNGLGFDRHGSLVSAGEFGSRSQSVADEPRTLEIWLSAVEPEGSSTLLRFYKPEDRSVRFSLHQWGRHLWIQESGLDADLHHINNKLLIENILSPGKPVFVAISSGVSGTSLFVNGVFTKRSADFKLTSRELKGRLIVADQGEFIGELSGLAIYGRELSQAEIADHYAARLRGRPLAADPSLNPIAVFCFDEGIGSLARNQIDSSTDLVIPEHYFNLHPKFLEWPWREWYPGSSYYKYLAVNIVGFIPLGFFFRAYLSAVSATKRDLMWTIMLGFAVSLTIETLQAFLPTRESGMTDIITNTLGTALGALFCDSRVAEQTVWDPISGIIRWLGISKFVESRVTTV